MCVMGGEGGWGGGVKREGINKWFTELRPLCVSNREAADKADTGNTVGLQAYFPRVFR